MPKRSQIEEAMVHIWMLLEKQPTKSDYIENIRQVVLKEAKEDLLDLLLEKNLLQLNEGQISLTPAGEKVGRMMVRRNRLAERLFSDILELPAQNISLEACKFEHFVSPDVEERICTLLGHPTECPHGEPIPAGKCCQRADKKIQRIICSLSELKAGDEGKIAYIKTGNHPQLHKLMSLGIIPGVKIKVHQIYPTFVLAVEETQLALDAEVAAEIFVRC